MQFSNGAQFGYGVNDQAGTSAINDCTGNGWHTRRIALDVGANATISNWWIDLNEGSSGSGPWDLYVSDVAIVKQNGSVVPLFTKGSGVGLTSVPSNDLNYSNITNLSIGAGVPSVTVQQLAANATTYYHADHLGTAQMEFAGGGWPVWTGDFAPYGQEINPQQTANNYKFTGLERDAEGNLNLDHAQFRQYSSQTGRWMSPDPYGGSMDLGNPQSLNRYAYVGNMPLGFTDPSGLDGKSPIPTGGGVGGCIGVVLSEGANPIADLGCGISILSNILNIFKKPQCNACNHTRPNGGLWDEHGSYKPKPYTGVADILGIAQAGCEFGSCGTSLLGQANKVSGLSGYTQDGLPDPLMFNLFIRSRIKPAGLPWYHGNWCGPGGAGPTTDAVDEACQRHDYCYFANKLSIASNYDPTISSKTRALLGACNQRLCNEVAVSGGSWAAMNIQINFTFLNLSLSGCDGYGPGYRRN